MKRCFVCLAAVVASTALLSAQARNSKTLDIYVVDVEGGNATLIVPPSGESLLIDAGNGGMGAARDAGRIVDAAKDAGLTQLDHVIITHWHALRIPNRLARTSRLEDSERYTSAI